MQINEVVEICKTLMTDNLKILILDEPTSALSTDKAQQLHKVVAELSQKGVAVIYISHKLDEIGIVSDRIVILRNGQNVGELSADEVTQDQLIDLMGGGKRGLQSGARLLHRRLRRPARDARAQGPHDAEEPSGHEGRRLILRTARALKSPLPRAFRVDGGLSGV